MESDDDGVGSEDEEELVRSDGGGVGSEDEEEGGGVGSEGDGEEDDTESDGEELGLELDGGGVDVEVSDEGGGVSEEVGGAGSRIELRTATGNGRQSSVTKDIGFTYKAGRRAEDDEGGHQRVRNACYPTSSCGRQTS